MSFLPVFGEMEGRDYFLDCHRYVVALLAVLFKIVVHARPVFRRPEGLWLCARSSSNVDVGCLYGQLVIALHILPWRLLVCPLVFVSMLICFLLT